MIKRVRAPVRIDFAGGWTDVINFCSKYEGAVVNAAINSHVIGEIDNSTGLKLRYELHIPSGNGLGSSAALNVVWLALAGRWDKKHPDIAEAAYNVETILGTIGGKQDQYAAVLGGFNLLKFNGHKVTYEPLDIKQDFVKELEEKLLLAYTGKPRLSTDIHKHVWGNFDKGKNLEALHGLKDNAYNVKKALLKEDFEKFAECLSTNWKYQKQLHPSVTNEEINGLFNYAFKNGAIGGKACGAGGGGCLLFACENSAKKQKLASLLKGRVQIIDFKFDFDGLKIEKVY